MQRSLYGSGWCRPTDNIPTALGSAQTAPGGARTAFNTRTRLLTQFGNIANGTPCTTVLYGMLVEWDFLPFDFLLKSAFEWSSRVCMVVPDDVCIQQVIILMSFVLSLISLLLAFHVLHIWHELYVFRSTACSHADGLESDTFRIVSIFLNCGQQFNTINIFAQYFPSYGAVENASLV